MRVPVASPRQSPLAWVSGDVGAAGCDGWPRGPRPGRGAGVLGGERPWHEVVRIFSAFGGLTSHFTLYKIVLVQELSCIEPAGKGTDHEHVRDRPGRPSC